MLRALHVFVLITMTVGLLGCSSTRFETTWKDPNTVFGKLHGEKIAAFLISDSASKRRPVEDALARELTSRGGQGVAGYELLSGEQAQDEKVAADLLVDAGIQAVVTLRVVSEDELTTTSPGTWHQVPTYRSWGGYWYPTWRNVYEPGHTRTDKVVKVETLIYDMQSRKLIWAGLSKTTNPGQADAFVRELTSEIDRAISKAGLMR